MKAPFIAFEEEAIKFLRDVIKTLPTTGHKFAAGAMLAASSLKLEEALGAFADEDGKIDTDKVRALIGGGFASSGDKVTFTVGGNAYAWLLKPVSVSLTEADMMAVVDRAEARQLN